MDDDKNKPGVTQIPLIHDLALNPTQPRKPPGKLTKPSRKPGPYPPGYDPDTVDLFEGIVDPIERANEDTRDTLEPDLAQEADNPKTGIEASLRAELSDELGTILEHLKDLPEA